MWLSGLWMNRQGCTSRLFPKIAAASQSDRTRRIPGLGWQDWGKNGCVYVYVHVFVDVCMCRCGYQTVLLDVDTQEERGQVGKGEAIHTLPTYIHTDLRVPTYLHSRIVLASHVHLQD